jgi:hypothetical protein
MHAIVAASLLAALVIAATSDAAGAQMIEEPWSAGGLHGTLAKPCDHAVRRS